jgi:hypothetical protein
MDEQGGYLFTLLNALTTGTSEAFDFTLTSSNYVAYIIWSSGVTAGAVQLETAETTSYAGTWAPIGSPVATSAASKVDVVHFTGPLMAVRARITTTVAGGTVTVKLIAR